MRKVICDRCGAEIPGARVGYIAVNWRELKHDTLMQPNPYEKYDFCENCMAEILTVIDSVPPGPEPEPDPEPAEDPEEHSKQIEQEVEQILEEAQQEEPPKPKDKKRRQLFQAPGACKGGPQ